MTLLAVTTGHRLDAGLVVMLLPASPDFFVEAAKAARPEVRQAIVELLTTMAAKFEKAGNTTSRDLAKAGLALIGET